MNEVTMTWRSKASHIACVVLSCILASCATGNSQEAVGVAEPANTKAVIANLVAAHAQIVDPNGLTVRIILDGNDELSLETAMVLLEYGFGIQRGNSDRRNQLYLYRHQGGTSSTSVVRFGMSIGSAHVGRSYRITPSGYEPAGSMTVSGGESPIFIDDSMFGIDDISGVIYADDYKAAPHVDRPRPMEAQNIHHIGSQCGAGDNFQYPLMLGRI